LNIYHRITIWTDFTLSRERKHIISIIDLWNLNRISRPPKRILLCYLFACKRNVSGTKMIEIGSDKIRFGLLGQRRYTNFTNVCAFMYGVVSVLRDRETPSPLVTLPYVVFVSSTRLAKFAQRNNILSISSCIDFLDVVTGRYCWCMLFNYAFLIRERFELRIQLFLYSVYFRWWVEYGFYLRTYEITETAFQSKPGKSTNCLNSLGVKLA